MYGDMHVSSENACVGTSAAARKADINIPYKVDISFFIICALLFIIV
jgi:hypothetical protein